MVETVSEFKERIYFDGMDRRCVELAAKYAMAFSHNNAQRTWGRKQWRDYMQREGGVSPVMHGLDAYIAAAVKAGVLRADP